MAPASNEEQFKFLISCIRYSNNGKVDFGQVASECKIVSKGAAAKRYERMMRTHGIAPNAATIKSAPSRSYTKSERRESSGNTSKKRKAEQFLEENTTPDDEEGYANIKPDPIDSKEQFNVKEEDGQLSLDEAANLMQFYNAQSCAISQLGEKKYGCSDFEGSSVGYHSPLTYGLQAQQPYDFSRAYDSAVMNNLPTPTSQIPYQSPYQYNSESHSGTASPVVLE